VQIQTVTRAILGVALVGVLATPAVAQTRPATTQAAPTAVKTMPDEDAPIDISAGYLFTRALAANGGVATNVPKGFFFGADTTGTLGLAVDVTGAFKSGTKSWGFTAGPRISSHGDAKGFAQVLVGLNRQSGSGVSVNAFRIAPGGGVDIMKAGHVGVVAEGAYTLDRNSGVWSKGIEFGIGILFGVGK
jgi:hypothetical protein